VGRELSLDLLIYYWVLLSTPFPSGVLGISCVGVLRG